MRFCRSVLLPGLFAAAPALGIDWPQFGWDARHAGVNPSETAIHRGNVATLHQLWSATLPAVTDDAPVLLEGVATASGTRDILFVTTKDGRLVAVDAATGTVLWSKQPATTPGYTTSAPVVDPSRRWVYSYGLDGKVHKYAPADGTEVTTGGWPQTATLKGSVEKCSSALATAVAADGTTWLYAAHGGYPGDAGDYQGHVTAIDLTTGAQNVFNANCTDQAVHFTLGGSPDCAGVQNAIWGRPAVAYDANDDRIYLGTGNGTFNASSGGRYFGDSVFSLHADGTGASGLPLDSYTPTEYATLQSTDADLGSTTPALLPLVPASNRPRLAVQVGKDAQVRLLDLANLSGSGGPAHVGGEIQKLALAQGGGVLPQPAVWTDPATGSVWVFIANGSGISGLELSVNGSGNPSLATQWTKTPGGSSPVVANGILYYAGSAIVRALDPLTGGLLWSGAIGNIHWQSPIVVNGRVFVADQNAHLTAFRPNAAPLGFYPVVPCRVFDTRNAPGATGGPSLAAGATRLFPVAGSCGVPADALAVAANVTVVPGGASGSVRVGPAGASLPTSNVSFAPGRTRADFAVVSLTGFPLGSVSALDGSAGPIDLILDVAGYFK